MKVDIREEIARALRKRIEGNEDFPDVESYVNFILGEVVGRLDGGQAGETSQKGDREMEKRLRRLGYLD